MRNSHSATIKLKLVDVFLLTEKLIGQKLFTTVTVTAKFSSFHWNDPFSHTLIAVWMTFWKKPCDWGHDSMIALQFCLCVLISYSHSTDAVKENMLGGCNAGVSQNPILLGSAHALSPMQIKWHHLNTCASAKGLGLLANS